MAKMITETRVTTGEIRCSYEHLVSPTSFNGSDPKYSVSALIRKDDKETLNLIEKAIANAHKTGMEKYRKQFKNANIRMPLHDGDEERSEDAAYQNTYYINCSNKAKVTLLNRDKSKIEDTTEIYSGVYGELILQFYPYSAPGNSGIGCSVLAFRKTRDGEALGGSRVDVNNDFDDAEDDGFLN